MQTSVVCRLAFVAVCFFSPMGREVWGQEAPPTTKRIEKPESGSQAVAPKSDSSDINRSEPTQSQSNNVYYPPKALPENNESIESISERNFRVQISK